ncbi:hypothetical protein DEFDS_2030 [Deferribacter desulfuricans SSM1]|uniref:Lipoprotein n=1 Tax=Deferribacter desulfuricans (strain DSM 14783 / JCM 11476 / NBRC 101012 / SSM1) TaxID=639282 RepID=D3P9U0_DEFDS|nr:hypothetical protein [Deferribacter desulfuricans]BAI81480.1 hypothetical protein DEFDS_2030 [Deferribacter desulfuricans SSM1]
MKYLTILLLVVILTSCSKPSQVNYVNTVANPKNSYTRFLKSKYTIELNNIVENIKILNLNIVNDGIGFTGATDCKKCDNKPGDFWLFINFQGKNLNALIEKNINIKIKDILQNKTKDILFVLKNCKLDRLIKDNHFKGFLISGVWGVSDNIKEILSPKKYQTAEYYITKETFSKFIKGEINYSKIFLISLYRFYQLK